jgi:hypothetical protein
MDYKQKYLKYKAKYLNLKNNLGGAPNNNQQLITVTIEKDDGNREVVNGSIGLEMLENVLANPPNNIRYVKMHKAPSVTAFSFTKMADNRYDGQYAPNNPGQLGRMGNLGEHTFEGVIQQLRDLIEN